MKYLITIFAIMLSLFVQAQEILITPCETNDTLVNVVIVNELPNGSPDITYLTDDACIDSSQINDVFFKEALDYRKDAIEHERYVELFESMWREYNRLLVSRDTNFYDYTWAQYGSELVGDYLYRINQDTFSQADVIINQVGRTVLRTDVDNAALRIEGDIDKLLLVNFTPLGENVELLRRRDRPDIWVGRSSAGDRIVLRKVK